MGFEVEEVLGWSDQPHAVVGLRPVHRHVHHRYRSSEVFDNSPTIRVWLNSGIEVGFGNEGVDGFEPGAASAVGVES